MKWPNTHAHTYEDAHTQKKKKGKEKKKRKKGTKRGGGVGRKEEEKRRKHPWDTHYLFSIKTLLSKEKKRYGEKRGVQKKEI